MRQITQQQATLANLRLVTREREALAELCYQQKQKIRRLEKQVATLRAKLEKAPA